MPTLNNSLAPLTATGPYGCDPPDAKRPALRSRTVWNGFGGSAKTLINGALARFNLQLTGVTAERLDNQRLSNLALAGYFDRPGKPLAENNVWACRQ